MDRPDADEIRGRLKMKEIRTDRLILRPFKESDYDDLFEFLSQLEDDEFEGYPGINYEIAGSI